MRCSAPAFWPRHSDSTALGSCTVRRIFRDVSSAIGIFQKGCVDQASKGTSARSARESEEGPLLRGMTDNLRVEQVDDLKVCALRSPPPLRSRKRGADRPLAAACGSRSRTFEGSCRTAGSAARGGRCAHCAAVCVAASAHACVFALTSSGSLLGNGCASPSSSNGSRSTCSRTMSTTRLARTRARAPKRCVRPRDAACLGGAPSNLIVRPPLLLLLF